FVVLGVVVYGIYCAKNHSNESIKNKIVELENKLNSLEKQGSGDVRESLKDEIKVLLAQLTQDKDSYPNEVLPKLDELNLRFLLELNDVLINDISEESDHTHDMNIKGITVPKELQTERVDWSVNLVGVL
ncbi:MAG: hypothetical protein KAR79_00060, partial [Simkaniaceae bacterium]|nr:hypothetical protein [Simkaniaceae bacterium]